MSRPSSPFSHNAGFTLPEALVSIAIIGIVVAVLLGNQTTYNDAARLTLQADELASRVNEAQVYGVAVKERTPGTADFSVAYGIAVSMLSSGSNSSYILFVDRNGNRKYDGTWNCDTGGANECIEKVTLTNGNYIDDLCNIKANGSYSCGGTRRMDVTFLRPDTRANIIYYNESGTEYAPGDTVGERITLKSPTGLVRYMSLYLTGQVSVHNS